MSRRTFNCRRCGNCCLNLVDAYSGCVSDTDLELWRKEGRGDILARVDSLDLGRGNVLHTAWIIPETGEDADRCPWLGELSEGNGYFCSIETIKPEHCRSYPQHRRHAEGTGCPGYSVPTAGPLTANGVNRRLRKETSMGKDLYVGNISFKATEEDIMKLFSVAGKVRSIHLITDPKSGQFKGCGFVKMADIEAREAIAILDGALLVDRVISVSEARPQKQKEQGGATDRGNGTRDRAPRPRRK